MDPAEDAVLMELPAPKETPVSQAHRAHREKSVCKDRKDHVALSDFQDHRAIMARMDLRELRANVDHR